MKYFTMDRWLHAQSLQFSNEPWRAYREHFERIRDRLTPDLVRIDTDGLLHDGELRELTFDATARQLTVVMDADDEQENYIRYRLEYGDVEQFEISGRPEGLVVFGPDFGDLGYLETDLVGKRFEHRMLFSTGVEWRIVFGAFTPTQQVLQSSAFDPKNLESPDADVRRLAVIKVSRTQLGEFAVDVLELARNDPDESVRRHAIRALGNLRFRDAVPFLMEVLESEGGLIVGDAVQALGKLGAHQARYAIESLRNSDIPWVAEQARCALKALSAR